MEVLGILAVIGLVVATVVKFVSLHQRKIADAWSDAAEQLGMRFTSGSFLRSKMIHGEMYNNRVEVDTFTRSSGKSSATYTRFRIHYPEALGIGLHLKKQGFLSGVASFFGSQDIEVGDPEFDQQVVVKGASPWRVLELLTASRRLRILGLFQDFPECEIKDHLIEWSKRGNLNSSQELVATVRRLTFEATRLHDSPGSAQLLDPALEARPEGRLDEAKAVSERASSERASHESSKDKVLAQRDHGTHSLKPPEVKPESEPEPAPPPEVEPKPEPEPAPPPEVEPKPEPEPAPPPEVEPKPEPEPAPPPEVEPEPEPAAIVPAPAPEQPLIEAAVAVASETTGLEVAAVCEDLFTVGGMSFEVNQRFDDRYKNRPVRWSGDLRRISSYTFDMVFSGSSGTKIAVDIHVVAGRAFGRTVQAIVQLPEEALEELRTRIGERITFEGRLMSCDAVMRKLYVADGVLG